MQTNIREYEFTLITKDLPEDQRSKLISKYEEAAIKDGGTIIKKDVWGTRKLAYPMKKQYRGHYVWYDLATQKQNIADVEKMIKFDDNILKYMVIKTSDKVDIQKRRAELEKEVIPQED